MPSFRLVDVGDDHLGTSHHERLRHRGTDGPAALNGDTDGVHAATTVAAAGLDAAQQPASGARGQTGRQMHPSRLCRHEIQIGCSRAEVPGGADLAAQRFHATPHLLEHRSPIHAGNRPHHDLAAPRRQLAQRTLERHGAREGACVPHHLLSRCIGLGARASHGGTEGRVVDHEHRFEPHTGVVPEQLPHTHTTPSYP